MSRSEKLVLIERLNKIVELLYKEVLPDEDYDFPSSTFVEAEAAIREAIDYIGHG
jgi:hypothetical protein